MSEKYGPWYQMPWWLKWPVHGLCRVYSYLFFGWLLFQWLTINGRMDRCWYRPDGKLSMEDSERLHLEILWSMAIGKGEMYAGAWVEIQSS